MNEQCSFCGKHKNEVSRLITNTQDDEKLICSDCTVIFKTLIDETPSDMKIIKIGVK